MKRWPPFAIAGVFAAVVIVTFVVATQASIPKSTFTHGLLWSILVMIAMTGWGSLVAHVCVPGRRIDAGLRLAWGASVILAIGGVLAATSLYGRFVIMAVVDVGLAGAAWEVFRGRDEILPRLHVAWRAARRNKTIAILLAFVVGLSALHFIAALGDDGSNHYDDDIAYFPLVKRLVQTGSLIEPFSFRRLSTLGGQQLFHSLLYPHATFQQLNVFDRGICVVGVVLLVLGFTRKGRRPPAWFLVLALALFLNIPHMSINTASHFSGVVMFLGLFRTILLLDELAPVSGRLDLVRRCALPALVATAACTLRQNFLAPAVITVASSELYVALDRRGVPWRERLVRPTIVAALSAVFLIPWLVLSYRSSLTPLYPALLGTYNPALALKSNLFGPLDEIRFFIAVAVDNVPIRTMALFVVAGAIVRETAPSKPLRALWIGSAVGYAILCHTLSQSDAGNISRYLFGFLVALALATTLTVGTTFHRRASTTGAARFAGLLVVLAVVVQIVLTRDRISQRYDAAVTTAKAHLAEVNESPRTADPVIVTYANLQAAFPPGKKIAFMVDEPFYLDFSRNELFNIDMPGYASLPPGLPYFRGAEAKAEYFRSLGIHHLLFVTSDYSRAHYKRDFWWHRIFGDEEIWRLFCPYQIDMIDDLAELSRTHKILYQERGIIALDLDATGAGR